MAYSVMPLFVQATFLFFGLFRIQFTSISTEDGKTSRVLLGFTNPSSVVHPKSYSSKNTTKIDVKHVTSEQPTNFGTEENGTRHRKDDEINNHATCGPGKCSSEEICVTWIRQSEKAKDVFLTESPIILHECLLNDGVHWNKMNPTGAKLCSEGKTEKILHENQSCLNRKPVPCTNLNWKYVCVDEKDSPHSCNLKKCRDGVGCVEVIHCGFEPPCYKLATCVPKYLTSRAK